MDPRTDRDPRLPPVPGVLFDQYSRYASCAERVLALLPDGGTVLDVGSGGARLLGRFLPDHRITYLDPDIEAGPDAVRGTLLDGGLGDRRFDVVVSVDTLEHVPVEQREAFLGTMTALAQRGVIVSAPCADVGEAAETDAFVAAEYRERSGRLYPWLEEHLVHGLPLASEIEAHLRAAGFEVETAGNGRAPWLRELLGLHVVLLDTPDHLPFLREVGERFARDLYRFEHLPPVYRQITVAWRGERPSVSNRPTDPDTLAEAEAAWAQFRSFVHVALSRHLDGLTARARELADRARAHAARAADAERRLTRTCAEHDQVLAERERLTRELDVERTAAAEHRAAWDTERQRLVAHTRRLREALDLVQRSVSWRCTAPLRWSLDAARRLAGAVLAGVARVALGAARTGARVLGLRGESEWRLKSAFFTVFAPLLRGTREYREFAEARAWRNEPPAPVGAGAGVPAVGPPHADLPDVLVFGIVNWDFRIQRPQHLARQLALRGHRVFYLSPGFTPAPAAGFRLRRIEPDLELWEARLCATGRPSIYTGLPGGAAGEMLTAALRELLAHVRLAACWTIVDHPGWHRLARLVPRACTVYDCMDNHHGFAVGGETLAREEAALVAECDGLVVTSDWLEREMRALRSGPTRLLRNGCDPAHFAAVPAPKSDRRTVGYFGAMAEWFDVELVRDLARDLPECEFLLVGADTAGVGRALSDCPNVRMTGEVDYAELPGRIAAMDVCIVPFVIDDLTRATNPVKAYEALAAGRPVVATPMPELMRDDFRGLVRVAERGDAFLAAVRAALDDAADPARVERRRRFAADHSWASRALGFAEFVESLPAPRVSVVVVTWNNVDLSRRTIESVLQDPAAPDLEVIVVDNASSDGTAAWLDALESAEPRVRVIRNRENHGFAHACNQGLAAASGDWLVILNNDVVVTPGWARTLVRHLVREPAIGLIGPVTNNIGNEARIRTTYTDLEAMPDEQAALTAARAGSTFDIAVLAFFCVVMPRDVYEQVGGLDEAFEIGFFEDDDYCQRIRAFGRRVVCAEDVFVHHELSASFKQLARGERDAIFDRNRAYYESKWGPWQPHRYRRDPVVSGARRTVG